MIAECTIIGLKILGACVMMVSFQIIRACCWSCSTSWELTSVLHVFSECIGIGSFNADCAVRVPSCSYSASADESTAKTYCTWGFIYHWIAFQSTIFPIPPVTSKNRRSAVRSLSPATQSRSVAEPPGKTVWATMLSILCCSGLKRWSDSVGDRQSSGKIFLEEKIINVVESDFLIKSQNCGSAAYCGIA